MAHGGDSTIDDKYPGVKAKVDLLRCLFKATTSAVSDKQEFASTWSKTQLERDDTLNKLCACAELNESEIEA